MENRGFGSWIYDYVYFSVSRAMLLYCICFWGLFLSSPSCIFNYCEVFDDEPGGYSEEVQYVAPKPVLILQDMNLWMSSYKKKTLIFQ